MQDPANVRLLLTQFEELHHDIGTAGGTLSRAQLISKIGASLTKHYNPFLNYWKMSHYNVEITDTVFKDFKSLLIDFRNEHKDSWNNAKDTKPHKANDKGNDRNKSVAKASSGERITCSHCKGNGHSVDTCKYVGKPDVPKCTYKDCGKLSHTEDNCRMKARALNKTSKDSTTTSANADVAIPDFDSDFGMARIVASTNDMHLHDPMNCTSPFPSMPYTADVSQNCDHGDGIGLRGAAQGGQDRGSGRTYMVDRTMTPSAFAAITTASLSNLWICDSGAARHITNDSSLFTRLDPVTEAIGGCKKGSELAICGKGTIDIVITDSNGNHSILELHDVRYAPDARCNLLSISTLSMSGQGFKILIDGQDMLIHSKGANRNVALASLHPSANVYVFYAKRSPTLPTAAAAVDFDDPVWSEHRRLGHLSLDGMRRLLKISDGIKVTDKQIQAKMNDLCPICHTTRALYKIPRGPAQRHYNTFGQLVTVDTWGPYPTPGLDGERYALCLIDDATRFTWVELFPTKDRISALLTSLLTRLANEHGHPIVRMRCDNEFVTRSIQTYCTSKGITVENSVPYAHFDAGAIERSHRSMRERASAMIEDFQPSSDMTKAIINRTEETLRNATLPDGLWTYAVREAVYKKNRAPSKALKYAKTPWEALYGTKPDLSKDNAWGARVYVTIPPELRLAAEARKLHVPRAYVAHFLCADSEKICWV